MAAWSFPPSLRPLRERVHTAPRGLLVLAGLLLGLLLALPFLLGALMRTPSPQEALPPPSAGSTPTPVFTPMAAEVKNKDLRKGWVLIWEDDTAGLPTSTYGRCKGPDMLYMTVNRLGVGMTSVSVSDECTRDMVFKDDHWVAKKADTP